MVTTTAMVGEILASLAPGRLVDVLVVEEQQMPLRDLLSKLVEVNR
jgi:hypothetical protein